MSMGNPFSSVVPYIASNLQGESGPRLSMPPASPPLRQARKPEDHLGVVYATGLA